MVPSPPHSSVGGPCREVEKIGYLLGGFFHIRRVPDLSPDLPLPTVWSITLQRAPGGRKASPNKAPSYYRGELANDLMKSGPSRPSDGCSGPIRWEPQTSPEAREAL